MKHWHQCQRWRDIGYECPLGRFEEDEDDDDDDDDGIPIPELIPIPAKKPQKSAAEPANIDLAVAAALVAVQEILDPQGGVAAPRPEPVTVQVRGEFRLPPTNTPPLVAPPPQPTPSRDVEGVFVTEEVPGMIPRVAALLEGTFALAGGAGGDLSEEERTLLASANEEAVTSTLPPSGFGGGRLAQLLNDQNLDILQTFGLAIGVAGIGFVFNWADRLRTLMSQPSFQVAPFEEGLSR